MTMRASLAIVVVVGCAAPTGERAMLPGASPTKRGTTATAACGEDITYGAATSPSLRYAYTRDARGRLVHAEGAFAAGGRDDSIDYGYDNLDHVVAMVQARASGDAREETVTDYDTLGDVVGYTDTLRGASYTATTRYTYSGFDERGAAAQVAIESDYTSDGATTPQQRLVDQLAYDADGRLASYVETDVVAGTTRIATYTYDDDGRTLTFDYDRGSVHEVIVYDDAARELSDSRTGTGQGVVDQDVAYTWDRDRLVSIATAAGTMEHPHDLAPSELDVYRYDCPDVTP
jgi:hypothetical protein